MRKGKPSEIGTDMSRKKVLKTIVISYYDMLKQQAKREELENFMNQIRAEYDGRWFYDDCLLSEFCEREQIQKENTLFLAEQRRLLGAAKELNMAVVACEACIPAESMEKQLMYHKEHRGFIWIATNVWENENLFLLRCFDREKEQPWDIMETEHLLIREEWEDDLDAIYEMYEQEHIRQFLEPPYDEREKELEYMRKYREYVYTYYGYGLWHLVDKQTGMTAGRAGLTPKSYGDGANGMELGYMIAKPFLQRGYCMEACKAIIEYAREELEAERLFCLIHPDNKVSIHIAEKLGFHIDCVITENGQQMLRLSQEFHCKS